MQIIPFVILDGKVNTFWQGLIESSGYLLFYPFLFNSPAVPFPKLTAFCICCYSGYWSKYPFYLPSTDHCCYNCWDQNFLCSIRYCRGTSGTQRKHNSKSRDQCNNLCCWHRHRGGRRSRQLLWRDYEKGTHNAESGGRLWVQSKRWRCRKQQPTRTKLGTSCSGWQLWKS